MQLSFPFNRKYCVLLLHNTFPIGQHVSSVTHPKVIMRGLQESWDAYLRVPLDASARKEKLEHLERFLAVVLKCAAQSADELHFGTNLDNPREVFDCQNGG
ncbi:hypothetical protein CAPTEDRAFT_197142 [Capitella teleta]|uniref:Uncharacterized protein n=1 Tax=Capitella teleta TaxID=283909 RepID=R7TZG3_CAPTE|nr:hypothetical protein CAPTEDRAFT_197142 [Capitella teleta]|eukprot:ELT99323.1 hypothetical protein CAPTEDRAFT_197142 [Capitella teleta]